MSKQPRKVVERLKAMKLLLPEGHQDPRQLWILVRQDPSDNSPGCFFVTHGMNFEKFDKRKGFEVIGHSFDKVALTQAARRATIVAGPSYQPKFSAHNQGGEEPSDSLPEDDAPPSGIIKPDPSMLN